LLSPCSYFLAALLLLLINSCCSFKWLWWLICFAGVFVMMSGRVLVMVFVISCSWAKLDGEMVLVSVRCGCLCWLCVYIPLLLCWQHMLCMWWLCCFRWSSWFPLPMEASCGCVMFILFGDFFWCCHLYFWLCKCYWSC
jgi:hypothetical protein